MNYIMSLKKEKGMNFDAISAAIFSKTGKRYSPKYLGNVAYGEAALSDGLRLHLFTTFGDFNLLPHAHASVNTSQVSA